MKLRYYVDSLGYISNKMLLARLSATARIDYLGAWEQLYNPNFKLVEFDQFKREAGTNAFVLL